ncbi:MAG: YceD family protein [Acutalibacteraceae bacterium]
MHPLFAGDVSVVPIETQMDLSGLEVQGQTPFAQPVRVSGTVEYVDGVVTLRADVRYRFDGVCDQCAEPFSREVTLPVSHILVTSLNDESNEDFVLLKDFQLELDDLITADLLLSLPMKFLCRQDCRGICPQCGRNLNEGDCGCRQETVDPRLAALLAELE